MANIAHVYPRGFLSSSKNNDHDPNVQGATIVRQVSGDELIGALFGEYQANAALRNSTEFKLNVCTRLSQLIGSFSLWANVQANNNRYLYDQNWEYFLDTIKFIQTGRRSLSPFTWLELMNERPDPIPGIDRDRWLAPQQRAALSISQDYIGRWVSHRGGFDDLMMSAYIMFGECKNPNTRVPHQMV